MNLKAISDKSLPGLMKKGGEKQKMRERERGWEWERERRHMSIILGLERNKI